MNFSGTFLSLIFGTVFHSCCTEAAVTFGSSTLAVITPNPTHCGRSESGYLNKMEVTNCTAQPCALGKSTNVSIAPTFTPSYDSVTLTYQASFHQGCGSSSELLVNKYLTDTFKENNQYRLEEQFTVPTSMAGKSGCILIYLYDDEYDHISRCFDVRVSF